MGDYDELIELLEDDTPLKPLVLASYVKNTDTWRKYTLAEFDDYDWCEREDVHFVLNSAASRQPWRTSLLADELPEEQPITVSYIDPQEPGR